MDALTALLICCAICCIVLVIDDKVIEPWTHKQIEKDLSKLQKLLEKRKEFDTLNKNLKN